jgi:hypothetical protein
VSRIRSIRFLAGFLALAATLTPGVLQAQASASFEAGPGRPAVLMPAPEPERVEPGSDIIISPGVDLTRAPTLELPPGPDIVLDRTGALSVPSRARPLRPVPVTVRSPPGVALLSLLQEPGAAADRQCTGDCELRLVPGRYRFGLTYGLRGPVMAPGTFQVDGPDVLEVSYKSEHRKRIGGWLLLSLGLPGGITQLAAALNAYSEVTYICEPDEACRADRVGPALKANIILGAITATASAILGGWLVTRRDRARVRLRGPAPDQSSAVLAGQAALEPALELVYDP